MYHHQTSQSTATTGGNAPTGERHLRGELLGSALHVATKLHERVFQVEQPPWWDSSHGWMWTCLCRGARDEQHEQWE